MLSLHTYYKYRELIWNLVVADLKNRYKNSALGFLWSFMNPLLTSAVLIFVFMHVFKFEISNYPLYLISGIIAWRFFAMTSATMYTILTYGALIKKIYFPRQILVFSSCLSVFISSGIEFIILFLFAIALGGNITFWAFLTPFFFLVQFLLVLGISLGLSALYIYFRDLEHIWTVLLQAGFYAAPIIYPSTLIPPSSPYYLFLLANPMSHFIITYRHLLMYGDAPALGSLIGIAFFTIAAYAIGLALFKWLEPNFAEVI